MESKKEEDPIDEAILKKLLVRNYKKKRGILIEVCIPPGKEEECYMQPYLDLTERLSKYEEEIGHTVFYDYISLFPSDKVTERLFFEHLSTLWGHIREIRRLLESGENVVIKDYSLEFFSRAMIENAFGCNNSRLPIGLSLLYGMMKGLPMPDLILHFWKSNERIEASFVKEIEPSLKDKEGRTDLTREYVLKTIDFCNEKMKQRLAEMVENVRSFPDTSASKDVESLFSIVSVALQKQSEHLKFY